MSPQKRRFVASLTLIVGVVGSIGFTLAATAGHPSWVSLVGSTVVTALAAGLWLLKLSWLTTTAITWLWFSAAVGIALAPTDTPTLWLIPASGWFGLLWTALLLVPVGIVHHYVLDGTSSRRG